MENKDLIPQQLLSLMVPNSNPSPLGLLFGGWSARKRMEITRNETEQFNDKVGMMKTVMTFSSDIETHLIVNRELQEAMRLDNEKKRAEVRVANSEAIRAELELEQFRKAMNDPQS